MSWQRVDLQALRRGEPASAVVQFLAEDLCVVEVSIDEQVVRGDGADLFEAMVAVRLELERGGVLLACSGARRDVYPSPMLRQGTRGRRAYVLGERSMTKPPTVDIFEPAAFDDVGTVAEQREYYRRWLGPPPPGFEGEPS